MGTSTQPCQFCQHEVAWSAPKCPGCGGRNPHPMADKVLTICIVSGVAIALIWLNASVAGQQIMASVRRLLQ